MKLVAQKRAANDKQDLLTFVRADGSTSSVEMPRQGVLPHDLIHYVVESGLALRNGFLSLVARGAEARFVMELTHDPQQRAVEQGAVQAEAAVEALQTQLWNGAFDPEAFAYGLEMAATARGIAPLPPPDVRAARGLYDQAVALHQQWRALPPFGTLELEFAVPT